ncbi:MAG: sensor domain-containing diguanylate cyclase [Aliidiomarina sp.]|uniref:sensor domain-containing diguanylate cyclase n=1 Tax=Aliidiomarina sp. TaxID=1872439 RepID=UPI0025C48FE8|nr:sensor domain-containing diguanylate cyclase [Aliidiomarina sp.]MCH8500849.1 sensor domain-containing diguanylate cyclase [Aliidiomarina sp.]
MTPAQSNQREFGLLHALAQHLPYFLYTLKQDPDGTFQYLYASENSKKVLGIAPEEVLASSDALLNRIHKDDRERVFATSQQAIGENTAWSQEFRIVKPDGSLVWVEAFDVFEKLPDGSILFHGYALDITNKKLHQEYIQQLAHYDVLTQLPNRTLFTQLLHQQLKISQRENYCLALLFVDLDYFKPVNDSYGHAIGDQVLQEVARRLQLNLRQSDLIARIGGDEFVIALPGFYDHQAAESTALRVADKIRQAVCEPILVQEHRIQIAACIGIALYPQHSQSVDELLRFADQSMYEAKRAGRNRVVMFETNTN